MKNTTLTLAELLSDSGLDFTDSLSMSIDDIYNAYEEKKQIKHPFKEYENKYFISFETTFNFIEVHKIVKITKHETSEMDEYILYDGESALMSLSTDVEISEHDIYISVNELTNLTEITKEEFEHIVIEMVEASNVRRKKINDIIESYK